MAIDARCPFCAKAYRLKDDLVGKKVTCANGDCRKVFPVEPIVNAAPPSAMDAETMAMSAFADEPAAAAAASIIAMTCAICEHKWDVPLDMQGKNVLCPDCKHRQKVPIPKDPTKTNWRDANQGKPSLAKGETLTDVTSARDTAMVSGETLLKTGVIDDGVEPVPLKVKLQRVFAVIALLLVFVGGPWWYFSTRSGERKDIASTADLIKLAEAEEFANLHVHRGVLRLGIAEQLARRNTAKDLPTAVAQYNLARQDLEKGKGLDRDAAMAELAVSLLNLGGTPVQVAEGEKLPWEPKVSGRIRSNAAEEQGVHGQLRLTLLGMKTQKAEFDLRAATYRKLARELNARGQPQLPVDLLSTGLNPDEEDDVLAQIGIEYFRAGNIDKAKFVADELITRAKQRPAPASAITLWNLLNITGPTQSGADMTMQNLARKDPSAALTAATGISNIDNRMKALALGAEWAEDPKPFLEAADKALAARPPGQLVSQSTLSRLAAMAGAAGEKDKAAAFGKAIGDANLKAWAAGNALRERLKAKPEMLPDADAEVPPDVTEKNFLPGMGWGRMALARGAAKVNPTQAKTMSDTWPKPLVHPYGRVGFELGVQDP